jgi:hypothetical protein
MKAAPVQWTLQDTTVDFGMVDLPIVKRQLA